MTSDNSFIGRRATIRTLALGGIAALVTVRAAGAAAVVKPPSNYVQKGWFWCNKCEGMFYGWSTAGGWGVCPADGGHFPKASGLYSERVGPDIPGVQQGGWSWCNKCMIFFYANAGPGAGGMGHCPAGGTHSNALSASYAAVLGEDGLQQQGGWRWCRKCMGMFYARDSIGFGVCPAGGFHDPSASGHYASLT